MIITILIVTLNCGMNRKNDFYLFDCTADWVISPLLGNSASCCYSLSA